MPRIDKSLHAFISGEAASTGQLKRLCESCNEWVKDEFYCRSKYCQNCRPTRGRKMTAIYNKNHKKGPVE